MDVTGDKTEGEVKFFLQHIQPQVEVVEDGVAPPKGDLRVLGLDVLDISLHLAEDNWSDVGLELEHPPDFAKT